jgi:hypothetical protein
MPEKKDETDGDLSKNGEKLPNSEQDAWLAQVDAMLKAQLDRQRVQEENPGNPGKVGGGVEHFLKGHGVPESVSDMFGAVAAFIFGMFMFRRLWGKSPSRLPGQRTPKPSPVDRDRDDDQTEVRHDE